MLRTLTAVAVLLAPAVAVSAQVPATPEGWSWRLDAPQAVATGQEVADGEWRYQRMPPGWHVTTTEQGVVLVPDGVTVTGRWAIEVELFLFPNPSDEGLGIALVDEHGLGDLLALMRRDGQAALVVRNGPDRMVVEPWTRDTAVIPHDTTGIIKYVLRLAHESGHLVFTVDGHEMFTHQVPEDREAVPMIPGLRIGAGLNVHVSRFDLVTPLAPARPRGGGGE